MNRRELLKLILSGIAGHALDVDRLLWVPGVKKIFIPSGHINIYKVISLELGRITPKIQMLFEIDNAFYKLIENHQVPIISSRLIHVPLSSFEDVNSFEDEE